MSFDFSSLLWIFIAIALLQAPLAARWYVVRRAQAIRAIEKLHGTRVITMIHRQEKRSLFGFAVSRHIDLEDAQTIIAAIKDTPEDMPIDFVIHTPGGLVLAAMQIARAVEAHKAKVTVYVPVYAMSGGTLIALAADEIVLGEFSVLGPIDPQIAAGSVTSTNTIGTRRVACSNNPKTVVPTARTRSGSSATNSAAYLAARAGSPAVQRVSIRILRPSVQPSCCKPCK
ncbi:MAG: ATP-dependent Clp protease proteolytic subunit, partial [Pseudolabrys sp.]